MRFRTGRRNVETQGNRDLVSISLRKSQIYRHTGRQPLIVRPGLRDSEKVDRHREKLRDERYTFLVK